MWCAGEAPTPHLVLGGTSTARVLLRHAFGWATPSGGMMRLGLRALRTARTVRGDIVRTPSGLPRTERYGARSAGGGAVAEQQMAWRQAMPHLPEQQLASGGQAGGAPRVSWSRTHR